MDRAIQEAVQQLSGTQLTDRVHAFDATVVSVNEEERTCVVLMVTGKDAAEMPDVRLMAAVDDGILIVPEIDSTVTVITSTYGEPYISSYSEVKKIVLMGGDLAGMVKLLPLLERLNAVENDLNTLKQAFTSWVVVPNDGGAALKAASSSWVSQPIEVTNRGDLENTNITQG